MARKNGMTVELGKIMNKEFLAHAGVKGTAVPADATIVASNVNLALLAMALDGKPFSVTIKPMVTLVNFPAGSNSYFPTVKFSLPAGAKIGTVAITADDKVLEFEHYKVWNQRERKYDECRPSALKETEIAKGALKALETKMFPKSDLTDKPVPPTDYCTLLAREFGWDSERLMKAAEYCEKYGMTFRGLYEGEVQKRKMNKK